MRLIIAAARLPAQPWTDTHLIAVIARGLSARGWAITLLCDAIEDAAAMQTATGVGHARGVIARQPYRQDAPQGPVRFARWAGREMMRRGHDVSLSTTRLVRADAWLPLEPSSSTWLARLVAHKDPVRATLAAARYPSAVAGAAAESYFTQRADDGARPVRVLLAQGGVQTDTMRARWPHLADRTVDISFASGIASSDAAHAAPHSLRRRARALLGLSDRRVAVAVPTPLGVSPALKAMLEGARALRRCEADDAAPPGARSRAQDLALVFVGRDGYRVHGVAARLGMGDGAVRVAGMSGRADAVIVAADCAAVVEDDSTMSARFAADTTRCGMALLASRRAPAAELTTEDAICDGTPAGWADLFARALDPRWRAAHGVAGMSALTHERFIAALDDRLCRLLPS